MDFFQGRLEHLNFFDIRKWGSASDLLQIELTLDEAFYPSLSREELDRRNFNQVVSRECEKTLDDEELQTSTKPILIVPQMWIWCLDGDLVSAYSMPFCIKGMEKLEYGHKPSRESFPPSRNPQMWMPLKSANVFEAAAVLLDFPVTQFGMPQAGNKYPPPLDLFEIGVVRVLSDVGSYMARRNAPLSITAEGDFMARISDIRNELAMVKHFLCEQRAIIEDLATRFDGAASTLLKIDKHLSRIAKIDGDAERIEKTIQDMLNLKRTYASMREARLSILVGMAAAGFAVVAIVFAPLSFMTSLYALPIDTLSHHMSRQTSPAFENREVYSSTHIRNQFGENRF